MRAGSEDRVYLFDTTLRDGAQMQGVDFGVPDKETIARELDRIGMDYVEGGWPGANPTDDAFFANPPALKRAPSNVRSRGSAMSVGTPAATNASRRSSNSLQVGTSRQSTMAICGGCSRPPHSR